MIWRPIEICFICRSRGRQNESKKDRSSDTGKRAAAGYVLFFFFLFPLPDPLPAVRFEFLELDVYFPSFSSPFIPPQTNAQITEHPHSVGLS